MSARKISVSAVMLGLILLYWAGSLNALTILPRVYEDEPWQASTALKLARQGVFASDLFAGYAHMDRRYYDYLPLYPIVLAGVYRIADVGLFQTRWLGIACGVLMLALTYALARRVWHDARIGVLACVLLLSVRWFADTVLDTTGILFWDATRIARYDVLVPVFALLAAHVYLYAQSTARAYWYALSGALVGLCGLTHIYGFFVLGIFIVLIFWKRERHWCYHELILIGATILLCAPYVFYVLGDVESWRAQTRWYAQRFDLGNVYWYWNNVRNEWMRYAIGLNRPLSVWLRPGIWFAALALFASWLVLLRRIETQPRTRVVFAMVTGLPLAYAVLLQPKFTNYLLLITPFAALLSAWGIVVAWNHFSKWMPVRAALVLVLALVVFEGVTRYAWFQQQADVTTPYARLNAHLRAFVPEGTRVLGLQRYWFGWDAYEYHSLAVPFWLANPRLTNPPVEIKQALSAQQSDYILLDDAARTYLSENDATIGAAFRTWLRAHDAQPVGRYADATYGAFEIYHVTRAP